MIPQLAHWIWFGSDLPPWAEQNIQEFRILHPDWTTRVWLALPPEFPADLRAVIDSIPWYSSRSDIFSYWLLATYGGVYMDTDIVPLRSFTPLLEHGFFLAPCQPEGHSRPHLNCALVGSERGSRATTLILEACRRRAAEDTPSKRIAYGPELLTRLFGSTSDCAAVLPAHYFYAIPDRETAHRFWHAAPTGREDILTSFRPIYTDGQEPYSVHLWGVDGSSQRKVSDDRLVNEASA